MEQKLKELLKKLNEGVNQIEVADPGAKVQLQDLVEQINAKLENAENSEHQSRLLSKLQESAIHFKDAHPVISANIQEIVDILTKMGI